MKRVTISLWTESCKKGYFFVVLAAICWALSGTSGKYLFEQGLTPYDLVQTRLSIAVVILAFFVIFKHPHLLKIQKSDILYFALLGALGMGMVQFLYFFAISKIKVAAAILLEYLAPVFITLYTLLVLREKPKPLVIIALLGSLLGCYLLVGGYNLDLLSMNKKGILGGLGAAVAFAGYSIYGERGMQRYHPWTVLFYALLFAAVLWNIIYPPMKGFQKSYTYFEMGLVLYIAILGTVVPFGLYFEGINLIRSTRASITAMLEPIFAALVSWVFLGETLTGVQMIGGALVIFSIILLQLRREDESLSPQALRQQKVGL